MLTRAKEDAPMTVQNKTPKSPKSLQNDLESPAPARGELVLSALIIAREGSKELRAIDLMAARLVIAARTLRALPYDSQTIPAKTRSAWPEFIQKSLFLDYKNKMRDRFTPNPAAIDDLNRLLDLFWHLTPVQRQLVWARACNISWAKLVSRFGRSRTSLHRDHKLALAVLCRHDKAKAADKNRQS